MSVTRVQCHEPRMLEAICCIEKSELFYPPIYTACCSPWSVSHLLWTVTKIFYGKILIVARRERPRSRFHLSSAPPTRDILHKSEKIALMVYWLGLHLLIPVVHVDL